jgi:hypothetical protein
MESERRSSLQFQQLVVPFRSFRRLVAGSGLSEDSMTTHRFRMSTMGIQEIGEDKWSKLDNGTADRPTSSAEEGTRHVQGSDANASTKLARMCAYITIHIATACDKRGGARSTYSISAEMLHMVGMTTA